jgi:hypothetical protein
LEKWNEKIQTRKRKRRKKIMKSREEIMLRGREIRRIT